MSWNTALVVANATCMCLGKLVVSVDTDYLLVSVCSCWHDARNMNGNNPVGGSQLGGLSDDRSAGISILIGGFKF